MKQTIERQNFRLIESELYEYTQTKREMELIQFDIIELGSGSGEGRTSAISKPTESKATKLMTSKELLEVRKRINAIEYMLSVLSNSSEPAKLQLVRMKYFERRYTDMGIWEQLSISKATFYRWRAEAVGIVAQRLGYKI